MVPIRISSGGKLFNLMHTEENIKLQITATQNHSIAPVTISIAPGATLSMAEFTKHVICKIFFSIHSQVTSNPVALRRLGTGKVYSSIACARFRMRSTV